MSYSKKIISPVRALKTHKRGRKYAQNIKKAFSK
jgi:hypothetical protein